MFTFGKPPRELTKDDLLELVEQKIQEDLRLDFKRDMYGTSDKNKREMLRDVSSMANSSGGLIVIGVDEDKKGAAKALLGTGLGNNIERITSVCLSGLDPRIPGLQIHPMELNEEREAIVVEIPQSVWAPHLITFQGLNQFWIRHGRQKERMTVDEIQEAFFRRFRSIERATALFPTARMRRLLRTDKG